MNRLRKCLMGALLAVGVVLGGLAVPSAAHADTGACYDGYFCMYTGTNETPWNAACRNEFDARTMGMCADKEESAWNKGYECSGCDKIAMYRRTNFTGAWLELDRGYYIDNLSTVRFNKIGGSPGSDGMGQTLWHKVESARWY